MLLGLSGKQRAGKDTFAEYLINEYGFERVAIGDMIKLEYSNNTGVSMEEIETNKHLHRFGLIELGKKTKAKYGGTYYIKAVIKYIRDNKIKNAVITDIRTFPEYLILLAEGGLPVRIEADRAVREKRGILKNENDITETDLDSLYFEDWIEILNNNSTKESLYESSFWMMDILSKDYDGVYSRFIKKFKNRPLIAS